MAFANTVVADTEPKNGQILFTKEKIINGNKVRFEKIQSKHNIIIERITNEFGKKIKPNKIIFKGLINKSLKEKMNNNPNKVFDVLVALKDTSQTISSKIEAGTVLIDKLNKSKRVFINGVELTPNKIKKHKQDKFNAIQENLRIKLNESNKTLKEMSDFTPFLVNKKQPIFTARYRLKKEELLKLLHKYSNKVLGVELYYEPKDQLFEAISAIDYKSHNSDGNNIGIYMSESGCPYSSHINNLTILGSSNGSNHAENVSGIIRGISSDSHIYCANGFRMPTNAELNGVNGKPRIFVENHSWGYVSDDDHYRTTDRSYDNHVYDSGVFVVRAAGNNMTNVSSPAKGLNVLTVGNYNDNTLSINTSSNTSDPETGNIKPEVSAPGTNITAGGHTMTGTSMASPVVASMATNLMTEWLYEETQLRPQLMKSAIIAGAKDIIAGGESAVGKGGANYKSSLNSSIGGLHWWEGNNNDFSTFDSQDYIPNNNMIDVKFYAKSRASKTRVVISWLNRGDYTYANRNASHAIGTDLDVRVYDPNGNYVGGSYSWDNGFEVVEFDPTKTGYYRVAINRYANRDTSSKLNIGLAITNY